MAVLVLGVPGRGMLVLGVAEGRGTAVIAVLARGMPDRATAVIAVLARGMPDRGMLVLGVAEGRGTGAMAVLVVGMLGVPEGSATGAIALEALEPIVRPTEGRSGRRKAIGVPGLRADRLIRRCRQTSPLIS
jgi:hypothetical protein